MTKEENEQFLQIKNKYKQSWLDDLEVDFLINSIEKLQCENRALKGENAEAWEEWNNLEQGSYQIEQNLKKQLEKLRIENDKLRAITDRIQSEYNDLLKNNFKLKYELETKRKEYQETYKDVREELKELRKENEELKRKNKTLEELLQGNLYELYKYYKELADTYQGNCIPVQKVKDKIEELDKKVKNYQCVENRINLYQRKVLQELLEEGEKNGKNKR